VNDLGRFTGLQSIWFLDDRKGWALGTEQDRSVVFATEDGGETWRRQYQGNDASNALWEVRFADEHSGWAVGEKEVIHTADGGATWQVQPVPGDAFLFGVEVLSAVEAWVVGSYGTVLHTTDGGQTWTQTALAPELEEPWLNSVRFTSRQQGWIVGNKGLILATLDGGTTWRVESKGRSSYLRGLTASGQYVFTYGNDGVILRRALGRVDARRQPN
jgi:photosystem II stability/assembly factor-like uncharacterized protein